jgi:hypothetical protein
VVATEAAGNLAILDIDASCLGALWESWMSRLKLTSIHACAAHKFSLFLVRPYVLLEIDVARICEEADIEVQRIVPVRTGNVDLATRIRESSVCGEGKILATLDSSMVAKVTW